MLDGRRGSGGWRVSVTAAEVLGAVKRRWYVVLLTLLSGVGLTAMFYAGSGVYTTQTVVQFVHLEPSQGAISPNSDIENGNFIAFAGAVASEVNNGRPVLNYAWGTAPLYGAGMREGIRVSIPDSGGQWMQSFNRAEIVIQIVGRTHESVATRQQELLMKVEDSSRSLQGPAYHNRQSIRTSVVPLTTTIEHVSPSRGQELAAVIAMVVASLVVGCWGAIRLDLRIASRPATTKSDRSVQVGVL